jgi:mono/diheme cytochrome c family protein
VGRDQAAATVQSPQDLYRLHCSTCHGDGTGNGHVAQTLKVRPRNLKHRQWQESVSDDHILHVIRDGGKSVKLSDQMPPFGEKLTEAELRVLAAYIRWLGRS